MGTPEAAAIPREEVESLTRRWEALTCEWLAAEGPHFYELDRERERLRGEFMGPWLRGLLEEGK